jgi:hypothetical protein
MTTDISDDKKTSNNSRKEKRTDEQTHKQTDVCDKVHNSRGLAQETTLQCLDIHDIGYVPIIQVVDPSIRNGRAILNTIVYIV